MRRLGWQLGLLLLAGLLLAAHAQGAPRISGAVPADYTLDLTYEPGRTGTISGTERIRFRNAGPGQLDRVWLRLWANGPDRCKPARIAVAVSAPATAEPLQVDCTVLPIKLASPLGPGESGEIALALAIDGRRASDRFGRSGPARLFGNVIPVLAVSDQLGLHLEPYVGGGESFYSLAAPWTATLRTPSATKVASTGAPTSQTVAGGVRTITVATAQARDFGLAFGRRMVTRRGRAAGVSIRVLAATRRSGALMLRVAKRSMRRFSARFGPYGSSELEVVETKTFGGAAGMEYPELVFSAPDPMIVAHEVAHQWWYGIVGNNQALEPWLDESFASYSDTLIVPSFFPCRTRRPFSILPRNWRRERLDAPMTRWAGRGQRYAGVVYVGGACALRSLERSLGRGRMTALLRLLVARHRFGVIDKADFLGAVTEVAPPGFSLGRWLARAHVSP